MCSPARHDSITTSKCLRSAPSSVAVKSRPALSSTQLLVKMPVLNPRGRQKRLNTFFPLQHFVSPLLPRAKAGAVFRYRSLKSALQGSACTTDSWVINPAHPNALQEHQNPSGSTPRGCPPPCPQGLRGASWDPMHPQRPAAPPLGARWDQAPPASATALGKISVTPNFLLLGKSKAPMTFAGLVADVHGQNLASPTRDPQRGCRSPGGTRVSPGELGVPGGNGASGPPGDPHTHGTCSGGGSCPPPAPTVPPQHPGGPQERGIDRPLGGHLLESPGDGEGGRQGDARGRGVLLAALLHLREELEKKPPRYSTGPRGSAQAPWPHPEAGREHPRGSPRSPGTG